MWRTNGRARGWGFKLVGKNDFQLSKFNREAPYHNFKCCYGEDGTGLYYVLSVSLIKSGDIYKSKNIKHFVAIVDRETSGEGVDLVMADGVI